MYVAFSAHITARQQYSFERVERRDFKEILINPGILLASWAMGTDAVFLKFCSISLPVLLFSREKQRRKTGTKYEKFIS